MSKGIETQNGIKRRSKYVGKKRTATAYCISISIAVSESKVIMLNAVCSTLIIKFI